MSFGTLDSNTSAVVVYIPPPQNLDFCFDECKDSLKWKWFSNYNSFLAGLTGSIIITSQPQAKDLVHFLVQEDNHTLEIEYQYNGERINSQTFNTQTLWKEIASSKDGNIILTTDQLIFNTNIISMHLLALSNEVIRYTSEQIYRKLTGQGAYWNIRKS